MRTDVRPDLELAAPGPAVKAVRRGPLALVLAGLLVAFGLAVSGAVSVVRDGGGDSAIRAAAGPRPPATVLGRAYATDVLPEAVATTVPPAAAANRPPPEVATAPPAKDASIAPPQAAGSTALAPMATTVPPATGALPGTDNQAAVAACRNSTDPACGAFRFDPQPGPDSHMTVVVTAEPASPEAGKPMVFRVTLHDPDGVSHVASSFFFGDSGIGESVAVDPCTKYGPWDPPARDPARATEVQEVSHTYAQAGSYTALFKFEAGPYSCVDGPTGRGDRPYASSAVGSVTVVVK